MAIVRGEVNGNAATILDFINDNTDLNGLKARLQTIDNANFLFIVGKTGEKTYTGPICNGNDVRTGNGQKMNGGFIMNGGGNSVRYGSAPYLPTIMYATSNGLLMLISIDSNQCAAGIIISKTNNGYYGAACQDFNATNYPFESVCAQALGDKALGDGADSIKTKVAPSHPGTSSFHQTAWLRDQIQLVPIPTRGNGVESYFPHAFWIPNSPTRQYGVIQVSDKKYVMSSYMALEE